MPPRKPREVRSSAPTPSPAPTAGRAGSRSRSRSARTHDSSDDPAPSGTTTISAVVEEEEGEDGAEGQAGSGGGTASRDIQRQEAAAVADAGAASASAVEESSVTDGAEGDARDEEGAGVVEAEEEVDEVVEDASGVEKQKVSMEDRLAKMKELRIRMNQSTAANRRDLVTDHQKQKVTAKELQRLEKQKKLAQTLRLKAEAEETGEDLERKKNWEWSIEQNERWEEKLELQKEKGDTHFHNAEDSAFKLYNRNIRSTKADLVSYSKAKEAALGLAPGTLVPAGSTSQSLTTASSSRNSNTGLSKLEDFYRGADTLAYGDSKPSEDAVDRVVGKINKDIGKGKRKKKDDDDGEVNYINDRNKVFNKKVARYYDKYTKEIRANFERGTAL